MGSVLPDRGRGSPLWLALGQGNSGQARRLAFLEPPPSGDYTVRVKPAPFGSCSPGGDLQGQALRTGSGLCREAGSTSSGLCSGDSFRHRGQPTSRVPSGGPC